jgi:gamma-glutamylcyclotransferase (GGCT)/AIG2-like uncharacterized protein YtfP
VALPLYFAYGANLDRAHMARLCPGAEARGLAQLDGHRVFIAAAGYASVRPAPGEIVHGVIWQVSARDFVALDGYESVNTGLYRRETKIIRAEGTLEAAVYVAADQRPGRPRPAYRAAIVAAARDWGLPEDHVRALETL